jgi:hypothetical protein
MEVKPDRYNNMCPKLKKKKKKKSREALSSQPTLRLAD